MRVWQVTNRAYSKAMLDPGADKRDEPDLQDAQRRSRNLVNLRAWLFRKAREYAPGRVLIMAQLGVREALVALGPVPGNIDWAHHNALAGRDEWRDVVALFLVGRTLLAPISVANIAQALTGSACLPLDGGWYPRMDAT